MKPSTQWTAGELAERLDRGERPFLLDVRNRDEFDAWRIEAPGSLASVNLPYFDILEEGGKDDVAASVREYFTRVAPDVLPKSRAILAVCAKGGTSEMVAEGLRPMGYSVANLVGGMDAWSAHYLVREIPAGAGVTILQVSRPARGCLSYVVAVNGRAAVIDPLRHVERYTALAAERGWRIESVIDTHAHADHVSGGAALAERAGARYFLHPYDAIHPVDVTAGPLAFEYLRDGTVLSVGDVRLAVMHVPGHTLGNCALFVDGNAGRFLFAGDTIFIRSIARPDLGGRAEAWAPVHFDSLSRLAALPGDTVVLPAHTSTPDEADAQGRFAAPLAALLRSNDDLRRLQAGRDAFVRGVLESLPSFPPEYVDIKRVNLALVSAGEERAAELETGKNVCGLAARGVHSG
jgi:glyoxylase-like metal-dependent hydrolase (beta-lactamase superfamily II)/rhodanese-related sulfurtransferase